MQRNIYNSKNHMNLKYQLTIFVIDPYHPVLMSSLVVTILEKVFQKSNAPTHIGAFQLRRQQKVKRTFAYMKLFVHQLTQQDFLPFNYMNVNRKV